MRDLAGLRLILAALAAREGAFTVEAHPAIFPDLSAPRVEYAATAP